MRGGRKKRKKGRMAVDMRQVIAAMLTISMFIMLGNMIKKDHIDPLLVNVAITSGGVQNEMMKVSKQQQMSHKLTSLSSGPWEEDGAILKPCRPKPSLEVIRQQPKGYIYLSLTDGPEFHTSQISNAIIIAKQLGAALVLPDIVDPKARVKRLFGEIYDTNKFLTSLDGIIQVVKSDYPQFDKTIGKKVITTVRVSNRVSKEFIEESIKPLFNRHRKLRIISYFTSTAVDVDSAATLESVQKPKYMAPYDCLVMFGSLELKPELQKLVESMARTLQHFGTSANSFGKFIAVDWNFEEFRKNGCQKNFNSSSECFDGQQVGLFLKKMGFERETAIYLTQSTWHQTLNSLREHFPNTFTKDAIIPRDLKPKYLGRDKFEIGKFIDLNLCTKSDVFVSTFYNPFQINVVGIRIASGKTQIYELARRTSETDYRSPYVTRKTHTAYSCFC